MKSAVCISGLLRSYAIDSFFRHLINPLRELGDVDIFVSTWTHTDLPVSGTGKPTEQKTDRLKISKEFQATNVEVENFDFIKEKFKFKNFSDRNLNELKPGGYKEGIPFCIPMFYKIYKSNLLKKKEEGLRGFKYDLVIRTRPDLIYTFPFKPHEDFKKALCVTTPTSWKIPCYSDLFFYSNSDTMDNVSDLYLNLDQMYKQEIYDHFKAEAIFRKYVDDTVDVSGVIDEPFVRINR